MKGKVKSPRVYEPDVRVLAHRAKADVWKFEPKKEAAATEATAASES